MTRFIRCDRCGAEIERDAMRADVCVSVLYIPGGEADTPFGKVKRKFHDANVNADLCEGCMMELFGFLKAEVPK